MWRNCGEGLNARLEAVPFPSLNSDVRRQQTPSEAALLLSDPNDRHPIPLAMSLARAWGSRLAAYAWRSPSAHLPERLQTLLRGHRGSAADLAVHNLVSSAFRGTQIPLRPMDDRTLSTEDSEDRLTMLAWKRGARPPGIGEAAACLDQAGGTLLLLTSEDGTPFDEVLVVDWEQSTPGEQGGIARLGRGLAGPYPLWRLKATGEKQVSRALSDLGKRSLLLLSPCPEAGYPLDRVEELERLSVGPVALLLASGPERSAHLAALWGGAS